MFDRTGGQRRVSGSRTKNFRAPVRGWIQSGNITTAGDDQAEGLDNYFPTAQGARLRRGCSEIVDLGASVKSLLTYVSGPVEKLFGATETKVFDTGRASFSNAFAEWEGLTSGDWSIAFENEALPASKTFVSVAPNSFSTGPET